MDLQLAAMKDPVLGRDFLTWLWHESERSGGQFAHPKDGPFVLLLEQRMAVTGGEGETKETATVNGPNAELKEARLGLTVGKKVHKALARIEHQENTWFVQLSADDFRIAGLKTPKIEAKQEEGDDPDAIFLEKMFLVEKSLAFLDFLYARFVRVRLSGKWSDDVRAIRVWLDKAGRD